MSISENTRWAIAIVLLGILCGLGAVWVGGNLTYNGAPITW